MSELILQASRRDGVVSLSLFGPLHQPTIFALRRALREHQREHVRLDMSNCIFIDLDGLLALAVAQRAALALGGSLVLCSVPPLIEDRIRRAHFDALIEAPAAEPTGTRPESHALSSVRGVTDSGPGSDPQHRHTEEVDQDGTAHPT